MIRCAIVEDEVLAREGLEFLLGLEPDVEVVLTADTYEVALSKLGEQAVDLLLLDVRLGRRTGFELLDELGSARPPAVVIVTSHDLYAHPAFDAEALDFVLKPVDRERFHQALDRARRLLARRPPRLALAAGGRRSYVGADEVDWIAAKGNYVLVHVGEETFLHRAPLARMEAGLRDYGFQRAHRSVLVNLAAVRQVLPCGNGEAELVLRSEERVLVSRRHREALVARLGG